MKWKKADGEYSPKKDDEHRYGPVYFPENTEKMNSSLVSHFVQTLQSAIGPSMQQEAIKRRCGAGKTMTPFILLLDVTGKEKPRLPC